ncbi:MAG: TetR/AcrR family transcriptional regulator [Deltaproteobacteria bacterium]|nr:TetR/AcrR family transcriptional regulator [Deltaproteobacteria bacterium]MCL5793126.1 TetR/AcrR family transcriptional regulator [Deltaproteobacteria bacterium]
MKRQTTEIRQGQIKKAVLDIIFKDGLDQLSTRNLAQRVGITEGAIFRHFKTKRDIMLSIMQDVKSNLIGELRRITLSAEGSEKRLSSFLCMHVNYLLENKGITILLFSEAAHMNDNELKSNLHEILSEQKSLISKIIKDGMAEGFWNKKLDVDDIATIYMGIPITLNIELILNPDMFNINNFCKRMFFLMQRMMSK